LLVISRVRKRKNKLGHSSKTSARGKSWVDHLVDRAKFSWKNDWRNRSQNNISWLSQI